MAAEPALDRADLVDALREGYGLTLDRASFLPHGTAPAYRVEGPGRSFFVKLLPDTPSGRAAAARLRAELPLLRALREGGVLERVPRPLPALDGAFITAVAAHPLIVYAWIEGEALGGAWTAALPELAPLLGRLHAGTAAVMERVPALPFPPEDFGLPFEDALQADLTWLRKAGPGERPGVRALADLLRPHEADLRRLLMRAKGLQAAARQRPGRFVLCHTDAHGGNVMRDPSGALWIIDWETARLAPPEHDLWMLHARLPELWPAYAAAAGDAAALDPDRLRFYFLRRVLEDLAVDVHAILREHTRPEDDEAALEVIGRFILPALARTEDDLARLLGALAGS